MLAARPLIEINMIKIAAIAAQFDKLILCSLIFIIPAPWQCAIVSANP
jgi:hypothetical protein